MRELKKKIKMLRNKLEKVTFQRDTLIWLAGTLACGYALIIIIILSK